MANPLFPDWMQSLLLLLFLGIAIALALQQAKELKKIQVAGQKKVYTLLQCGEKEYTREYREGDYVGARTNCNEEEGIITKIYAVYQQGEKGKKPMKT
ncbi:MAG: hypothetical protein F7C38_02045 [Desulfurococcales archaeon]|nr:hypothetical protein [Desulfurococcales archaeon]